MLAGIASVQEKNAELRGQLGVAVENKHELEALRLKCTNTVAEKARVKEKLLAASNQMVKLEEEAAEKYHEADQLICRLKQEAEVTREDLQNIKVYRKGCLFW